MRIEIFLDQENPVAIPIQYNHIIQAMIYSWIKDERYSKFIHDKGYQFNERIYKLFTFSRINGIYRLDKELRKIIFYKDMHITISSASDELMGYLLNSILLENETINVGGAEVKISRVDVKEAPVFTEKTKIYTLSPCTAYTTMDNKQTRFYNPFDYEFSEYIRNNLLHKHESFYGKQPDDTRFEIRPTGAVKMAKVNYKDFHILAYNCEMEMEGGLELQRMAYAAGIGGKNSQGFGCIEVKKDRR